MDKKEIAWQILCSKKMIAYLVDISAHKIEFLSPAAEELCYGKNRDNAGERTCYKVIYGLDAPCEFCQNEKLRTAGMYRRQFYSSHLGCWANGEARLAVIDGKEYRLEILEDLSGERRELEQKEKQLELEKTLVRCIELLAYEENTDVAIAEFLSTIGSYYGADRVYIMEYSLEAGTCSNTFEWCREGVESQMELLREVPLDLLKTCNGKFLTEGEFYVSLDDPEDDPEKDYRFVKMMQVHSFGGVPFLQENRVTGFLGLDNPTKCINEWILIRSVSSFVRDELKMRRLSKSLELASYTDALTGIGNRYLYQEQIKKLRKTQPGTIGIAVVDINGLKNINDRLGHGLGDKVIIHTGQVMRDYFGDSAYRVGGDEFVILCPDIPEKEFRRDVSRMQSQIKGEGQYSISVGVVWKDMPCDLEREISFADELMYAEKQKYYSEVIKEGRHGRIGIASDVLRDIQNDSYVVYLQPQVELVTKRVIGAEALIRKQDGEGKLTLPGKFVPVLEEEGIIRHIDFFVLNTVCRMLREWKKRKKMIRVAINFSRVTLMEPEVCESILEVCRKYGVDPRYIKIEITESVSKMGDKALGQLFGELEKWGFSISMDDFGYAFSNLAMAAEYRFSEMKLDQSMIKKLGALPRMDVIVKNSIEVINSLGVYSLAEGIETRAQVEKLKKFHCRAGQGYFFSKPMPLEEFEKFL